VSAPAFAQSNVTIYGTLDYGYTFQNRNIGTYSFDRVDANGNDVWKHNGVKSRSGLDSGVSKANRLGFKGTEDLGNGLKLVFVLETGLTGDNDSLLKNNARQSYAGLAGSFGTVAFGRHYTPQHIFTSAVDPFGKNGFGASNNVLTQDARLSNLVAYISPSWGGFSFITGFTNSYDGNESNENKGALGDYNQQDTRVWAFSPSYTNGGLFVGFNYHQAHFNETTDEKSFDFKHLRVYEGYVSYDFGPVKLGAIYGQRNTKLGDIPHPAPTFAGQTYDLDDIKVRQWLIGATWKITGVDRLLVSYAKRNVKVDDALGDDSRLGQWALGYEHSLSKRTVLYAHYAHQSQNRAQRRDTSKAYLDYYSGASGLAGIAGYDPAGVSKAALSGGSGYRQGFAVGVRHDF
jgi:predicted porin